MTDLDLQPDALAAETPDPVAQRAQFFFDLELAELQAVIPRAEPADPRQVY